MEKEELEGTLGKCDLYGSKTDLYPVELRIPNFTKGVVTENTMLCKKCLDAAGETYVKFKREEAEHGHGHH